MNPTAVAPISKVGQLSERLQAARARSDELFEIVRPEALYDRPISERHRIIFYLGHLEAFDWNLLREPLGLAPFHSEFDKLFAFGIDPVDGGLPTDQPKDWPAPSRVREYNKRIRTELDDAVRAIASDDPSLPRMENGRLVEVAIEHRLMHAETLCYMLHQLSLDRKFGSATPPPPPVAARVQQSAEIPAGKATLGLPRTEGGQFGWDNEFEEHCVDVPAFEIDAYNVTNADYLRFIRDGGYEH